jgi:hypothetical protein
VEEIHGRRFTEGDLRKEIYGRGFTEGDLRKGIYGRRVTEGDLWTEEVEEIYGRTRQGACPLFCPKALPHAPLLISHNIPYILLHSLYHITSLIPYYIPYLILHPLYHITSPAASCLSVARDPGRGGLAGDQHPPGAALASMIQKIQYNTRGAALASMIHKTQYKIRDMT